MKSNIQEYVIKNIEIMDNISEQINILSDMVMDTPHRGEGNYRGYYKKFSVLEQIFFLSYNWKLKCPIEDKVISKYWSDWTTFFYIQHNNSRNIPAPLLRPQYKCGKYKIDFAIVRKFGKIAIELDGFEYHDRDKKQFNYERDRQNYLVSNGYIILRFTWDDITKRFYDSFYMILKLLENLQKKYYGDK